ncbi:WD40 repeat domain-containing serine/threonine protein kinase [Nonomuraea rhodomycinica]|uniref:WD40 repeat domain-containing serine/threonine protein kinase n=1 Tax=Nonomuraea rhodomycinica TaxID=1712872 RepID=UPI0028AFE3F5|nr:protein kinase [Nonomuraea rhodomycinica]
MPQPRGLHAGEPREIGGYRVLGGLGDGGQGTVYLGEDADGRQVAVKVLHARLMGHDRATRRFLQECVIAGRVAAFCTARVIDSGLLDGRPYIVSEYVPGPSLRELVEDEGPRTGGALDRLAVGTVAALGAVHRAGIVHRDFKPANVLCGPDGPRVIDFGIAKVMEATTSASTVVGTPGYMSPEQIAGEPATPASDMFGWAATIAYAATGRSLFAGESIPAVMHRVLTEEPDLSGIDEPLRPLLAACLDKRPAARPSAADVLSALMEGGLARSGATDDLLADGPLGDDPLRDDLSGDLLGDGLSRDGLIRDDPLRDDPLRDGSSGDGVPGEGRRVEAGRGRAASSGTSTPERAGRRSWMTGPDEALGLVDGWSSQASWLVDGRSAEVPGEGGGRSSRARGGADARSEAPRGGAGRFDVRGRRDRWDPTGRRGAERGGISVTGRGRALAAGGLAVLVLGGVALGLNWGGADSPKRPAASGSGRSGGTGGTGVAEAYGPKEGIPLSGQVAAALAVGRIGDRTVVAVAPEAGSVELWDVATGRKVATTAPEDGGGVTSLAFAEVGGAPAVVWASVDGRVSRWSPSLAAATAGTVMTPAASTGEDSAPAKSAAYTLTTETRRAATSDAGRTADGAVRAFEACASERPPVATAVMAVVSREEGPAAAVGCADGRVQAWDLLSGRKSGRFFAGAAGVTGVAWPGSGSRVAFGTGATAFTIVDLWNRPEPVSVPVGGPVSRIVSHGALVAVSVKGEGGAAVYDARTGRQVCRVPAEDAPSPAALALTEADGRPLLAAAPDGGGLRVWDARTCEQLATLLPPGDEPGGGTSAGAGGGAVTALAAGPVDGRPGLVAAVGGAVRAWTLRGDR